VELPRLADHLRPGLELLPLAVEEVPTEERREGRLRWGRGRGNAAGERRGFIWIGGIHLD